MLRVKFLKDFSVYKKNDCADLESTLGARIIHRGIAKVFKEKKVSKKK